MTAPRSTGRAAALAVLFAVLLAVPGGARAQALVADLSNHLIAITTGFTGTDKFCRQLDGPGPEISAAQRRNLQQIHQ